MSNKAVFLDKDGTLIPNVPYNVNPDLIELSSGAVEGLRSLQAAGYKLIVISNQSGVALGYFDEIMLFPVQLKLTQLLAEIGVKITAFYYCPHHPEGKIPEYKISCSCRKPEPGLILRAARENHIDLANSWFIGDILNDVEAGHRAGCKSILINNGNETEWIFTSRRMPDYVATDINDAAKKIISKSVVFPKPKMTSYASH
ncbi:D-glycero-alpha-D-manno-heptose-1,7-bisphosphate 7-phosphatase [Floridanema aerugineum]|uniref:D,D-heptose 1,7-bisphosphate phosphatase n=1 Tax=Floridaenema aerugineum BLCC-F46 TaxID=3153654 RepID=A0ABV4XAE4_9CYAN